MTAIKTLFALGDFVATDLHEQTFWPCFSGKHRKEYSEASSSRPFQRHKALAEKAHPFLEPCNLSGGRRKPSVFVQKEVVSKTQLMRYASGSIFSLQESCKIFSGICVSPGISFLPVSPHVSPWEPLKQTCDLTVSCPVFPVV